MRRIHAFEIEDFPWVPRAIRNGATDLLYFTFAKIGFYKGVSSALITVLNESKAKHIVDLCSGGGGGLVAVLPEILKFDKNIKITLTDRYPNEAGAERVRELGDANIAYKLESQNAFQPSDLPGVRTMFGALHHFRPEDIKALLENIVVKNQPLAFFDVAASPKMRKVPFVVATIPLLINILMLFVITLLFIPFVQPFRWSRLLLTYVVPVIPILYAWDGMVSSLRAYLPEELLTIAKSVPGSENYTWESKASGQALFLTGVPNKKV